MQMQDFNVRNSQIE